MLVIMPALRFTKVGFLLCARAPGVGHQRASYWLHSALAQAAIPAGADAEVPEAVNVALPGGKLLVSDVVVWRPEPSGRGPPGFLVTPFWPWWRLSLRRRCR
jgi:hypothetical protein